MFKNQTDAGQTAFLLCSEVLQLAPKQLSQIARGQNHRQVCQNEFPLQSLLPCYKDFMRKRLKCPDMYPKPQRVTNVNSY